MSEREDAVCARTPRYIVFTVGSADVLVSAIKTKEEECPSETEVIKMRRAVDELTRKKKNCSPGEVVTHALRRSGYKNWIIVYVGEICHVEL